MPIRDPQKRKEYRENHYQKHREYIIAYMREYRKRDSYKARQPITSRICCLRKRYGLSMAEYDAILLSQDGKCAICGTDKPNNGKGDRWFDVDHDHATGKVRGLLCRTCNAMLGHLEKDAEHLADAYRYLGFKLTLEPIDPKP